MLKKLLLIISFLMLPIMVNATNQYSDVYFGNNLSVCSHDYQDNNKTTDGSVYFSHCMEAKCRDHNYKLNYYNSNTVYCSNGNQAPYTEIANNSACSKYNSRTCNNGEIMYCSMIIYYDCTRTSTGSEYTTKVVTQKTTSAVTYPRTIEKTTETTVITKKKAGSTKLASLKLSSGKINFSSDKYEYEVTLDDNVTSLNVTAVAEDADSKVKIEGNSNIKNGSIIRIIVTNTDKDNSTYTIKIKKTEQVKKSSNADLKSLKVRNHEFSFNPKVTNYYVYLESNENELDIYEAMPEDIAATVEVNNNSNLVNGSKVEIIVKAEDEKTTKTYIIDVRVRKQSNFIKILFIIVIILSILALGYYLYKKFVLSKTGEKYEYE